jgi:hypothetical protein
VAEKTTRSLLTEKLSTCPAPEAGRAAAATTHASVLTTGRREYLKEAVYRGLSEAV